MILRILDLILTLTDLLSSITTRRIMMSSHLITIKWTIYSEHQRLPPKSAKTLITVCLWITTLGMNSTTIMKTTSKMITIKSQVARTRSPRTLRKIKKMTMTSLKTHAQRTTRRQISLLLLWQVQDKRRKLIRMYKSQLARLRQLAVCNSHLKRMTRKRKGTQKIRLNSSTTNLTTYMKMTHNWDKYLAMK